MDCVVDGEEGSASKGYLRYKQLLESVLMAPFRRLGFLSSGCVFPVLLERVVMCVDRSMESTTRYGAELQYGRYRWRVEWNVLQIFSLNTYLCYKGILSLREDRLNLCSERRHECVEAFLRKVLLKTRFLDVAKVYEFFRISQHSFVGEKLFEDKFYVGIRRWCCGCFGRSGNFEKLYVVCKGTHIVFVDYKDKHKDVSVLFHTGELEVQLRRHAFHGEIKMLRNGEIISIKSFDHRLIELLYECLVEGERRMIERRRFGSFAPVRTGGVANFYVDGKSYFGDLYETLMLAKKEVLIAGWWVYPQQYLKLKGRDGRLMKRYRLDHVLKEIAERGVRVKVLVYREFQLALSIDSGYTFRVLCGLHKNVEVVRHPNVMSNAPLYWTHHEKVVVIDQRIAYVGGIDLAPGRCDAEEHSTERRGGRERLKRLPWHDVQCKIVGDVVFDVTRHFIERWNGIVEGEFMSEADLLIPSNDVIGREEDGELRMQMLRSVSAWSPGMGEENSIAEAYSWVIENARHFLYIENQFFITRCSGDCVEGPVNEIGRKIVERIERAQREGEEFRVYVVLPVLPVIEGELCADASSTRRVVRLQLESIFRGEHSLIETLKRKGIDVERYISFLSLRKIRFDGEKATHEQIYVHSKVMIADGTSAIVGSANINDRSMICGRDTEIAVLVEEEKGRSIWRLLRRLLSEHLGARNNWKEILVDNPRCLSFKRVFDAIVRCAKMNTGIFIDLFGLPPHMGAGNTSKCNMDIEEIRDTVARIKGHLFLFPHNEIPETQLSGDILTIDSFVPSIVFQ